jgi:hypothetical protein
VQSLAQRMPGDQALQLGDQLAASTRCQVASMRISRAARRWSSQPGDLSLCERLEGQVGQRRTPP